MGIGVTVGDHDHPGAEILLSCRLIPLLTLFDHLDALPYAIDHHRGSLDLKRPELDELDQLGLGNPLDGRVEGDDAKFQLLAEVGVIGLDLLEEAPDAGVELVNAAAGHGKGGVQHQGDAALLGVVLHFLRFKGFFVHKKVI